ncbi:MAG TPA: cation:proton antiporter [Gemmatimonadales bacterium]|nr:cation:proton antiporter [Gemmatimonadales bacterium]
MTFVLDIVVLLFVAVGGVLAARLLRLPTIAGYLLAGLAAGPAGLHLLAHSAVLDRIAELGVALLLFGVGVEVSLERLRRALGRIVAGGALQVLLTILLTALLFRALGFAWAVAAFVGCLVSLSSTAVVFKLYGESGELDAPHGQAAAGILLFQDLALIPMMLLVPVLAARGGPGVPLQAALALGKAALALVGLLVLGRLVLPRALALVARAGLVELFPLTALVTAFGTALLASALGLSLPIGAFLAGLALSGSRYSHQIFAELLPLRDAFVAVFFTSVGLLFDPRALATAPLLVVAVLAAVALKALVTGGVVRLLWRTPGAAVLTGLALAQVGEFAFILAATGLRAGLLSLAIEQAVLGATILTMAATPFLIRLGRRAGRLGEARPGAPSEAARHAAREHVLVVGYGRTGQAIARVLRGAGLPFEAIDLVPDNVEAGRAEGVAVRFGDATRRATLEEAGAAQARAAVVTVGDPVATRRIVALLGELNPAVPVIVRAHRVDEVAGLERLGADEVVPAELEATIEVFTRLLTRLGVPHHVVRMQERLIRAEHYRALQAGPRATGLTEAARQRIAGGLVETGMVLEGSPAAHATLAELAGAARVLAVIRDDRVLERCDAATPLEPGDLVVLFGSHEAVARSVALLERAVERAAERDSE